MQTFAGIIPWKSNSDRSFYFTILQRLLFLISYSVLPKESHPFELADFFFDSHENYFTAITIFKNIDPNNQLAIQALVKVVETSSERAEFALFELAKLAPTHKLVLEKIKQVITNVVTSIQTWEPKNSNQ